MIFVLKILFNRNSSTYIIFHDRQGFCTDKNPQIYSVHLFFRGGWGEFLQILKKYAKKEDFFHFKMCLFKSHNRSYDFCCLFMWKQGSSPTRQFTDTVFEDSSPTELKTVHRHF